jgi:hypothetical protein
VMVVTQVRPGGQDGLGELHGAFAIAPGVRYA